MTDFGLNLPDLQTIDGTALPYNWSLDIVCPTLPAALLQQFGRLVNRCLLLDDYLILEIFETVDYTVRKTLDSLLDVTEPFELTVCKYDTYGEEVERRALHVKLVAWGYRDDDNCMLCTNVGSEPTASLVKTAHCLFTSTTMVTL